jgi:hypothetical protein
MIEFPRLTDDTHYVAETNIQQTIKTKLSSTKAALRALPAAAEANLESNVAVILAGKDPTIDNADTERQRSMLATRIPAYVDADDKMNARVWNAKHAASVKITTGLAPEEARIMKVLCEGMTQVQAALAELDDYRIELSRRDINPCGRFVIPSIFDDPRDKTSNTAMWFRESAAKGWGKVPKALAI